MRFIDDSGGVPAKPHPWILRWIVHLLAAAMCLTGPGFIVASFSAGDDFWVLFIVGVVLSALMIPFGIGISVWISHEHRQSLRLRARGVAASAEILEIRSAPYGEENGLALTLRFTGPGITPFDAVYSCADDRELSVGDRLGALVDPTTNVYAIPNRR